MFDEHFANASMVYLHAVRFPFFAQYDVPEKYGLARECGGQISILIMMLMLFPAGKTINLRIHTADNVTVGAWFVFSDSYYLSRVVAPDGSGPVDHHHQEGLISAAVRTRPTVLFFHGNAGTRAAPLRIAHYSGFTSRVGTNVLAIDYRGFGDSTGRPSADGLARDARAAWAWLIDAGAAPSDILIVGHSLGTAVAARLGAELGREGVPCRGLVLLAPFSSMRTLLDTYAVLGVVPIGAPLSYVPGGAGTSGKSFRVFWTLYADWVFPLQALITWSLIHRFDTLALMPVRVWLT